MEKKQELNTTIDDKNQELQNKLNYLKKHGFKICKTSNIIKKHGYEISFYFIKVQTWNFIFDMTSVLGDQPQEKSSKKVTHKKHATK